MGSMMKSQTVELLRRHEIKIIEPLHRRAIEKVFDEIGPVPEEMLSFYEITNGFQFEWLTVFPLFDNDNVKTTWDSIQRANDVSKTKYLGQDEDLLKRFLVVAHISGGNVAVVDRNDLSVWYEDDDGLCQTDLTYLGLIETLCREVAEL